MPLIRLLQYCWLAALAVSAQSSGSSTASSISESGSGVSSARYSSYTSTITSGSVVETRYGSMLVSASGSMAGNTTSSSPTVTVLSGTRPLDSTTLLNGTSVANATTTSTAAIPTGTNTTPCNNFPEFCYRKYSNITMVCAHNSPFVAPGNAGANQDLPVLNQLNDGIRALQVQAHYINGTFYLCHTDCDILNAGTLTDYLAQVNQWVLDNPYDVVTIIIGNYDYVDVAKFVPSIEASGIHELAYEPPKEPMTLDDWPTLGQMILNNTRVVMFMDYQGNQTEVNYILVEFSQMWETPFDPTDATFPCTLQRPPGLSTELANQRLYMLNHNLNQNVSLFGATLSIPLKPLLPVTNNVSGAGSLGETTEHCYEDWGRPPNILNVDYYNNGSGSVFEVAAKWNNVTWTLPCCGIVSGASRLAYSSIWITMIVGLVVCLVS